MLPVLAFLALAALHKQVPTDAQIAARMTAQVREVMGPDAVTITVHRRSPVSTVARSVDVDMRGFAAEYLPFERNVTPRGRQFRIENAHLLCRDFTVRGLPIRRVEVQGRDVWVSESGFDTGALTVTAAARVEVTIELSEADLAAHLNAVPGSPFTDIQARITPQGCTLAGTWAPTGQPVTVTGALAAKDGPVLLLNNPTVTADLPAADRDRLLAALRPLTDLAAGAGLRLPVTVATTTSSDGAVVLTGTVDFGASDLVQAGP